MEGIKLLLMEEIEWIDNLVFEKKKRKEIKSNGNLKKIKEERDGAKWF